MQPSACSSRLISLTRKRIFFTGSVQMLFKIEGTNVFLLGSLHLGRTSFYPLPEAIDRAFSAAHAVWFEAPPLAPGHPMSQCPEGTTIRDHLSLPMFWALRIKLGNQLEGFKHLKPWALAI